MTTGQRLDGWTILIAIAILAVIDWQRRLALAEADDGLWFLMVFLSVITLGIVAMAVWTWIDEGRERKGGAHDGRAGRYSQRDR